jgi:hypothetical protein
LVRLGAQAVEGGDRVNLEVLGNIGDFLGGIGVVVTLVYLAAQIRQNTAQLRSNAEGERVAAADETTRSLGRWQDVIVSRRDVAVLWERGLAGDCELDSTDQLRFEYLAARVIQIWHAVYRRSMRAKDDEHWGVFHPFIRMFLRQPGFSDVWHRSRSAYPPDFIDEIERVRGDSTTT